MLFLKLNYNDQDEYYVSFSNIVLKENKDLFDISYGIYFPGIYGDKMIEIDKSIYEYLNNIIKNGCKVEDNIYVVNVHIKEMISIW